MSSDEKVRWITFLWTSSLLTVMSLSVLTALGWTFGGFESWLALLWVFGAEFTITLFAWLLRVTYLAGRRSS